MSRLTFNFREYVSDDPNGEEKRSFDIFETYRQPNSDLSSADASVKLFGVFTSSEKRFGDKFDLRSLLTSSRISLGRFRLNILLKIGLSHCSKRLKQAM
jgi:hypothetical protein